MRCPQEQRALLPLSSQVSAKGWVRQVHTWTLMGLRLDISHT